jgi:hypothetical protein
MKHRKLTTALLITASALAGAFISHAGPLDPPAGPVAPTYKTLSDVEPRTAISAATTPGDANSLFRITKPGSYYLTTNITGVAGKSGIEIAASGVTLDLNGFELLGVATAIDAITTDGTGLGNIHITGGSIRLWGGDGVDLTPAAAINCVVTAIKAFDNAGIGIRVASESTVSGCYATSNDGSGITALVGSTVIDSTASQNGDDGISVTNGCTVTRCTSYLNESDGISIGTGSTVTASTAYANTSDGISVVSGCTVTECSVYANLITGIRAVTGNTITRCTARNNSGNGIQVSTACLVISNTSSQNSLAGFRVLGADNRIEANSAVASTTGYDIVGTGNIIIRNTASGNDVNWSAASQNFLYVVSANAASLVNGNSGGTPLGSTDPSANFTY